MPEFLQVVIVQIFTEPRVFSSYEIIRDLGAYRKEFRRTGFFLHAEYEVLNMKDRMIEANESPNHRVISQKRICRNWYQTVD